MHLVLPPGAEGTEFQVERIELTESSLAAEGATYKTVGNFKLGGKLEYRG